MGKVIEFPQVGEKVRQESSGHHPARTPLSILFELLSSEESIRVWQLELRLHEADGLIAVSKRGKFKGVWAVGSATCDWIPAGYLLPSARFATPLEAAEHQLQLVDQPLTAQDL